MGYVRAIAKRDVGNFVEGETVFISERIKIDRRYFYKIGGVYISAKNFKLDNTPHI
jgi:hypothetical protein